MKISQFVIDCYVTIFFLLKLYTPENLCGIAQNSFYNVDYCTAPNINYCGRDNVRHMFCSQDDKCVAFMSIPTPFESHTGTRKYLQLNFVFISLP